MEEDFKTISGVFSSMEGEIRRLRDQNMEPINKLHEVTMEMNKKHEVLFNSPHTSIPHSSVTIDKSWKPQY
jgi:hypothetical protein